MNLNAKMRNMTFMSIISLLTNCRRNVQLYFLSILVQEVISLLIAFQIHTYGYIENDKTTETSQLIDWIYTYPPFTMILPSQTLVIGNLVLTSPPY